MKLRGGEGKWIFRRALEARLPDRVLYGKKRGFSIPLARWIRVELAPQMDDAARSGAGGLLDGRELERLLAEHRARERDHGDILYSALVLDRWYRRWIAASA
jgi:asparagine synthase (glutamine-hydrolysing)